MDTAAELEAIRQLKYAYFRTLDLKQFDALGQLLAEDATASYDDPRAEGHQTVLEGRAAIVDWLEAALGDPGIVTEHHGHHPEIALTSETTAEGTWYLQDRVVIPAADLEIGGTAFYEDRYRRTDAGWRIAHTVVSRVFEEHRTHSTMAVRSFTSRFGSPG
jgi:ketosteroid isomerase-like protein